MPLMFPHPGAHPAFLARAPLTILASWAFAATLGAQSIVPGAGGEGVPEPTRMATPAFGITAEIEVRDLAAGVAGAAIEAALSEVFDLSRLSDPQGVETGGAGELNRSAGRGPMTIDPRLAELLLRSLQFCIWSNGAYGPLGGELEILWSDLEERNERPTAGDLRRAVGTTECSRLTLRNDRGDGSAAPTSATAELAAGSRVDLQGIARGFAADRAAEILERHGAGNFWIEIGNVWRARGGGPEGHGWLATLPPPPGKEEPLDRVWLRDQALAIISAEPIRGETREPLVDQRTGVPARGVVTVVAVTELAVDAEPLVHSLFVLGHREGLIRLGSLSPRPSVYWLLGHGVDQPLEATYRWSELERVWRR